MDLWDTTRLTDLLAPRSLAEYQQDVRAYLRFCVDRPTAQDAVSLVRWRLHLAQATTLSPHTINRRLAAVKRLVATAAAHGALDAATAEAFRRVQSVPLKALKTRLRTPHRLTPGQMRQLCDAPPLTTLQGWRDRAFLHTLASSGARVSELVTLTPAQVCVEAGSAFVEIVGKNHTRPRRAPLSQEAYAYITTWLARRPVASAAVFTSFAGPGGQRPTPRPLERSAAWRLVQRAARRAELPPCSPHSFRRFVGTELAKRDIRQAQKALGHARLDTTARHYVLDELAGGLTEGLY